MKSKYQKLGIKITNQKSKWDTGHSVLNLIRSLNTNIENYPFFSF